MLFVIYGMVIAYLYCPIGWDTKHLGGDTMTTRMYFTNLQSVSGLIRELNIETQWFLEDLNRDWNFLEWPTRYVIRNRYKQVN